MNDFIEIPASKKSLSLRKPVYGVGTNDADYIVKPIIGGRRVICPFYRKWQSMLMRCYSGKYQEKYPTYAGCSVCSEWLTFSIFKAWMEKQEWQSMQLDKDLIVCGNKIYSPEFCVFVPSQLNALLLDNSAARGEWPQGVHFRKQCAKFQSYCNVNGTQKHLGLFTTPESASNAYKAFKSNRVKEVAQEYKSNTKLYDALMIHASLFK